MNTSRRSDQLREHAWTVAGSAIATVASAAATGWHSLRTPPHHDTPSADQDCVDVLERRTRRLHSRILNRRHGVENIVVAAGTDSVADHVRGRTDVCLAVPTTGNTMHLLTITMTGSSPTARRWLPVTTTTEVCELVAAVCGGALVTFRSNYRTYQARHIDTVPALTDTKPGQR